MNKKSGSALKRNYIYNLSYTLINTTLPLLTAPYLARVIGAEGVGTYAYYYAIAYFFSIFAKLGLSNYGTRQISRTKDSKEEVSKIFSGIFFQQLITSLVVSIAYLGVCGIIIHDNPNRKYALLMGIIVLGTTFDIDWLFSGLELFKTIARKNIFVKVSTVLLIFVLVKGPEDLWKYVLLMAVGTVVGHLSVWLSLRGVVSFCKVSFAEIVAHLKPNLILVVPILAMNVYRQMDKIMLGSFGTLNDTGLYENAEKIIYALCGFINAFGTVMMPRISNLMALGKKEDSTKYLYLSIQFMMNLMVAMCFGLLATSQSLVVILYGNDFQASGKLLAMLSVTLPAMGWANVIRTQYVIPQGKDHIYLYTVLLGAIVNLVANAVCIPKFGALGAVVGTICAEYSVPIGQYVLLRKEIDFVKLLRMSCYTVVCGSIMFLFVSLVTNWGFARNATLIVQIIVGILVYFIEVIIYLWIFDKKTLRIVLDTLKE